jgi:hypothetical protein
MDFDTQYQLIYDSVPNNPPPQLLDTSGAPRQHADWRIAYTEPTEDQHSSSLHDENAFLRQNSASHIPAGTENRDPNTYGSLHDGSRFIWQGPNSPIPGGTDDLYQFLQPSGNSSAMLGQDIGFFVPAGTRVFDQHPPQPVSLNLSAQHESAERDLGRHVQLPESGEQLPDLHEDYFDAATMTMILLETDMIPENLVNTQTSVIADNSVNSQSCFYMEESSTQGQMPPLDGTTIGLLSTFPQASFPGSWGNTETMYEDYNDSEIVDETFDLSDWLASDVKIHETMQQLEREAMQIVQFNSPSQVGPSVTQGKSPGDTRTCGKKRRALDLERELKRIRIPGLTESDGAVGVFRPSLDHLPEVVSGEKAQRPRNKVVCFLCRNRQKKVCNICY